MEQFKKIKDKEKGASGKEKVKENKNKNRIERGYIILDISRKIECKRDRAQGTRMMDLPARLRARRG